MGQRRWWARWSVRARVGWVLVGWALSVLAVALPVWALAASDLNEVAGWANTPALPITTVGLALVLADRSSRPVTASPAVASDAVPGMYVVGVLPEPADCLQERGVAGWDEAVAADSRAAVWILSGMGGVGKTQIAAAVARRMLAQRDGDVLLWITAGSADAIVSAYAQAGADVIGADARDVQRAATMFLSWLATTPKRWLVVLDDLDRPSDLNGWWPPRTGLGRVVAIAHFERLAAHATDRLGADHPDTLRARSARAHWRGEAGDATGAAVAFKDLVGDYARVLGPDHPDTLRAARSRLLARRIRPRHFRSRGVRETRHRPPAAARPGRPSNVGRPQRSEPLARPGRRPNWRRRLVRQARRRLRTRARPGSQRDPGRPSRLRLVAVPGR